MNRNGGGKRVHGTVLNANDCNSNHFHIIALVLFFYRFSCLHKVKYSLLYAPSYPLCLYRQWRRPKKIETRYEHRFRYCVSFDNLFVFLPMILQEERPVLE